MAKERDTKSSFRTLRKSLDALPGAIAKAITENLQRMEKRRADSETVTGQKPATQDGGQRRAGSDGDGGQRPQSALKVGALGGAAAGIAEAIRGLVNPEATGQEIAVRAATEGMKAMAEQTTVAAAAAAGLSDAQQRAMGLLASRAAEAAGDVLSQAVGVPDIVAAKGGAGDLERLASLGIEVDDETIRRRARVRLEQAARGRKFRKRFAGAVGAEAGFGGVDIDEESAKARERIELANIDRLNNMEQRIRGDGRYPSKWDVSSHG